VRRAVALTFVLALTGCRPRPAAPAVGQSTAGVEEPASLATRQPGTEPDAAVEETGMQLLELEVPGFLPAVVAAPESRKAVPLLISAHGAGGAPEWQCRHWAPIVAGRALVLCPRGKRISLRAGADGSFYYPDHFELEREFLAVLRAARARFAGRLLTGGGIYSGFSQGATMGALMIVEHGAEFPHLLLIEGATSEFSAARARRFASTGGKSVAFVCGGAHCAARADRMVRLLRRAGLDAHSEYVPHGGHTDDGAVGERARAVFEALLARSSASGG
jgi:predicted esterase